MSSAHNLGAQLPDAVVAAEYTHLRLKSAGSWGYMFAGGATVPSDGSDHYAKGCQFVLSGGTGAHNTIYINIGDDDSSVTGQTGCNFNPLTIA